MNMRGRFLIQVCQFADFSIPNILNVLRNMVNLILIEPTQF